MALRAVHPAALSARRTTRRGSLGRAGRMGLTLVEMLLALVILSMVSATIASMLSVFSSGSRYGQEIRRSAAAGEVAIHRLSAAMRSSAMVLACDDRTLVLWMADTRDNDLPDLSEVCRIEWDSPSSEIRYYAAPEDLSEAQDAAWQLSDDFLALTGSLRDTSRFPRQVWQRQVVGCRVALDAAPQAARLVHCDLTLGLAAHRSALSFTASLRGQTRGS